MLQSVEILKKHRYRIIPFHLLFWFRHSACIRFRQLCQKGKKEKNERKNYVHYMRFKLNVQQLSIGATNKEVDKMKSPKK